MAALAVMILLWPGRPAPAAVSQQPLLHPAASGDPPNLVLTLDDSTSMARRYLPDAADLLGAERRHRQGFHPADAPGAGMRTSHAALALTWTSDAADRASARMRSAAYNRLYYDPAVRYRPWRTADGGRWPDADPRAAWRDPVARDAVGPSAAVDLTGEQRFAPDTLWCHDAAATVPAAAAAPAPAECGPDAARVLAPATFYVWADAPAEPGARFTRVRIMDAERFERPASRTDCAPSPDGTQRLCLQAQEYRNFANWFSYHRSRLYAAIAAVSEALGEQEDSFRLGYGRVGRTQRQSIDGGEPTTTLERGVRPFAGADRTQVFNWLQRLRAAGPSSLRRALDDVGRYYARAGLADAGSPWAAQPWSGVASAHSPCRRAYHLLVSDGAWNGEPATTAAARENVDGRDGATIVHADGTRQWRYRAGPPWRDAVADTLADVALHYYARDLHAQLPNALAPRDEGDLFWQGMVNLVAGFGVGGTLDPALHGPALARGERVWPAPQAGQPSAVDDLWHAALNSGGRYLNLLGAEPAGNALAQALREVRPMTVYSAGIALSSHQGAGPVRKYVPSYQTQAWSGEVEAFQVDPDGGPDQSVWRASAQVPPASARQLHTWDPVRREAVAFDVAGLTRSGQAPALTADPALLDYLRGDRSREGAPWRRRTAVLGDIVNSQPLVVAAAPDRQYQFLPAGTPGRDSYRSFVEAGTQRPGLLFFGANDGMLHAVREADGVEVFGFIPSAVLGLLERLAQPGYDHRFFMDGPLADGEGWWAGAWHRVLLASAGAGAPSVAALEVGAGEAPDAVGVLWEFTRRDEPELGHVLAPPEAGVLRSGQWVAVFGNGHDSPGGQARLVVVDLHSGRLVRSLQADASGDNGLGGVRLVRDAQNRVVAAYAGDRRGHLWRFNLAAADPADWRVDFDGQPLFTAQGPQGELQSITAAPEYVDHPLGGQMVLVGTGRLIEQADGADRQPQALYGLWDRVGATSAARSADRIVSAAALVTHALGQIEAERVDPAGSPATRVRYDTVVAAPLDWRMHRGWQLPLPPGLRDLHGARFEKGFARFRLLTPGRPDTWGCGSQPAQGLDLQLQPLTGAMPPGAVFDTNGDGRVDANDLRIAGWRVAGEAPARLWLDPQARGRMPDSRSAGPRVDYGALRPARSWRQILNPPRPSP